MGAEVGKCRGLFLRKCKKSFLLRKYNNFFNLRVRKFHFPKYKEFFQGRIFFIFELKSSVSRNIRSFSRVLVSCNIRNFFRCFCFLKFFNIRAEKFHFLKHKEFFFGVDFFYFFELGLKSVQGRSKAYYFLILSASPIAAMPSIKTGIPISYHTYLIHI